MENLDLEKMLEASLPFLTEYGLKIVGAVVVLAIGWTIAGWIRGGVRKAVSRRLDATLVPFLSGIVYYLVLTFVILAVLNLFGVQTTSIIAVLGAAGLAVGLALQGTLSNFAAGVMLLVFRPFRVGDFVEAAGVSGSCEEVGLFTTKLNTPDNVAIIVPNSAVYGSIIKNYAANDTRRVDMVVGVSYDDDLGKAFDVMTRVVNADARVLEEPAPTIAVSEMADSSVNFVVRPWCKKEDYWGLRFDLTRALKEQLEANGCSIPYPQRDVHLFQAKDTPAA